MKIITFPGYTNANKIENPYQHLLYSAVKNLNQTVDNFTAGNVLKKSYDVVHIHWPESNRLSKKLFPAIIYSTGFLLLLIVAKLKGAKIVWTIHNLQPHENKWPLLQRFHFFVFTWLVDGFIVMTDFTLKKVFDLYKNLRQKKYQKIKHGHYTNYYQNTLSKSEARKQLGINADQRVFLFFGQVRKYKGLEELIAVFQENPQFNSRLFIVGSIRKVDAGYQQKLLQLIRSSEIILLNKFVKDDDIQLYMNAADLVILPYKNILNSGTLLLSLSFNKPIMLPSSPSIQEFVAEYGNDWIMTYSDLTPNVLSGYMDRAKHNGEQAIDLTSRSWDEIARQTIYFYKSVLQ